MIDAMMMMIIDDDTIEICSIFSGSARQIVYCNCSSATRQNSISFSSRHVAAVVLSLVVWDR